ncbi:MAG: zinc-binding dehydrogenase [Nitrospiraceae bacterium]|nr:zinc-binding dehydrogenase [Nitrospiraceae bacterium]
MRSVFVTQFGRADVIEVRDVPVPEPGAGQVLVRVHVAGLNYADIMQRKGLYPGGPQPPFPAGFEIAGTVEAVGPGDSVWKPGDEVMGFCLGGYSEYAATDANKLMPKPPALDFRRAAAIPCQYLTAYHTLFTLGGLSAGQTVLIQAAAGGLGTLLVQCAKNAGAAVIGTCSTAEKCELLASIGCDHPINYTGADFEDEVKRITGGAGCELVVESVGGKVFDKSIQCIKTRGRLITLGFASGKPRSVQAQLLLVKNITVSGFHLFGYVSDAEAAAHAMRDLQAWLDAGTLDVIVKHVYPLEAAAQAQRDIADRKTMGKVVLEIVS